MSVQVETLKLTVQNFENQITRLRQMEYRIMLKKESEMKEYFSNLFKDALDKEVVVEVYRDIIYFKMKDERDYLQDIFKIYLEENFGEEGFNDLKLNYYTTSSNSDFELIRLENLGRVANVVRNFRDTIISKANEICKKYKVELMETGFVEERYDLEFAVQETNKRIAEMENSK